MAIESHAIRECIIENLLVNLSFCRAKGITTAKQLRAYKLTKVVEHALWVLLELDGKYRGRYITEAATALARKYGVDVNHPKWDHEIKKILKVGAEPVFGNLIQFDHVVPKKFLLDALLSGKIEASQLENSLVACIVTAEEHRGVTAHERKPGFSFDLRNPWQTYKELGIRVFDKTEQKYLFS